MQTRSLLASLMLSVVFLAAHAQKAIVINEVMQSNIDYLMIDNDFPDSWVELYNTTDQDIDISGYYFGEKADYTRDWKLPNRSVIPAKGHFLIYCDKEAKGVHTDFRVDAGKAHLYLLDANGDVVDNLDLAEMPAANIAYGRVTDGADEWHYEFTPTAGEPNAGEGASELLPDPVFSLPGGIMEHPEFLSITMPEGVPEDAKIYVTLDGSEPTLASPAVPQANVPVQKTMVVRAKIMSPNNAALSGRSVTRSFIFHPRAVTMPVISLVSDRGYFYDSATGILVPNVNEGTPNYMRKWRRPVNVEYFDTLGNVVFNQLGETGVSGVSTREQPQKSLKVYTNKRFGKKNYKGNFWQDKPDVKKVKSFVIRSGGNNSFQARINDAAVQRLFGTHVDCLDWQAYQPVIVYLNGAYLGEFGMRERSDDNYVESNYDGLEDVEMADEESYQKPVAGSLFAQFYDSYHRAGVTYQELEAQMDMDNYVKSLIAQVYAQNTDFPTNNVSLWRPIEEGGKWRWILKDMDRFGMNLMLYPQSFDMLNYLFNPDPIMYGGMHHFDLYQKMATFPEFKELFVDKFSVYLGDFLRPEVVNVLVDSMCNEIKEELKATFDTYNCKFSDNTAAVKYLKSVINDRPKYLYQQLASHFNLGDVVPVKVLANGSAITINGVVLTEGDFDGSYFTNRALKLSADSTIVGWRVSVNQLNATVKEDSVLVRDTTLVLDDYLRGNTWGVSVEISAIASDENQGDDTGGSGDDGDDEDDKGDGDEEHNEDEEGDSEPDIPELAQNFVFPHI